MKHFDLLCDSDQLDKHVLYRSTIVVDSEKVKKVKDPDKKLVGAILTIQEYIDPGYVLVSLPKNMLKKKKGIVQSRLVRKKGGPFFLLKYLLKKP